MLRLALRTMPAFRLLALVLACGLGAPLTATATSSAPPDVRVYVLTGPSPDLLANQTFSIPWGAPWPLAIGATIDRNGSVLPVDVYLGFVAPGGSVFTWMPKAGGGARLVEGMSPVARGITDRLYATALAFGGDARHSVSERDTPGLYSVFAVLVTPGADPTDARQWHWASMVPLVLQGPPTKAAQ